MITKEQLAETLNGRKYGEEITPVERGAAFDAGLVVVFGYSDDNMMFRGRIKDSSVSCYDGGDAFITRDGLLENKCDHDDCPYHAAEQKKAKVIRAVWCKDGQDFTWVYETSIPHTVFEIHAGPEPYCRGIVFDLRDAILIADKTT